MRTDNDKKVEICETFLTTLVPDKDVSDQLTAVIMKIEKNIYNRSRKTRS